MRAAVVCLLAACTSPSHHAALDASADAAPDGAVCGRAVTIDSLLGHNTSASAHYDGAHFAANFGATTVISQAGETKAVDPAHLDMSENAVTPGHVSNVDVHTLVPARPDLR